MWDHSYSGRPCTLQPFATRSWSGSATKADFRFAAEQYLEDLPPFAREIESQRFDGMPRVEVLPVFAELPRQSARMATIGSTRVARRAGSHAAPAVTASRVRAASASGRGSPGATP